MELNANFARRVLIHTDDMPWKASPMAGVDRRMLDRIGDEVARATSIVRYAPRSHFSAHTHTGGEEFIVLEGTFQDEHGDYSAGTYVRNPPTSSHTPGAADGCVIFVKLWQFDLDDRTQLRVDMASGLETVGTGVALKTLHQDARETVHYLELAPNAIWSDPAAGGAELFVLAGDMQEGNDVLHKGSWLRVPDGKWVSVKAGNGGAKFWIKTGHLPFAVAPGV
ncbi:cupin domain-containing protein [Yoonia sp.]|uniref:cupin domain-containing protein n=1 Tax=Yoonia sp. TaxID=2212373 RepID=UPI0019FB73B3|nr:cupin domain-containing protein [Yoonia sp.]MBE0412296.1 cupin domain-containing protein [Yoonia sp.]